MANSTLRDEVWMYVIAKAIKQEHAVKPKEAAASTGASERMVRQCLLSISSTGILERQAKPDGTVRYVPSTHIKWTVEE